MTADKLTHLAWSVSSRARNQKCSLHLLRLFVDHSDFWKTKTHSRAAQELLAVAFSLWRAAFLAEKSGKRAAVFAEGQNFLARLIEDNAIAYAQDKNAREWTFNYYTRNARYSLIYLSERWSDLAPPYVDKTRTSIQRWDYCQDKLEECVVNFEKHITNKKRQILARQAKVTTRQTQRTASKSKKLEIP